MNGPQPWIRGFGFSILAALFCLPAANASHNDKDNENWLPGYQAEIVRVIQVQGDVRYNQGNRTYESPDLNKSWSAAEADAPEADSLPARTPAEEAAGSIPAESQDGSVREQVF